jgi:hypothetical protein
MVVGALPSFLVAVGPCRHLPRQFEATFANFELAIYFQKIVKKYIKNKKNSQEGKKERKVRVSITAARLRVCRRCCRVAAAEAPPPPCSIPSTFSVVSRFYHSLPPTLPFFLI